ncbi:type II secretion system F family protein [Patescibacteria group bacterium]|nr:MAG: type II secretion system F family protein [Patescibacteria group bacterium]
MPRFIYTAKNYQGEAKGGEMVAESEKDLAQQLRAEGFLVTSVRIVTEKKNSSSASFLNRFSSVPLKEKMMFARNLSVMVSSGVTVSRAINNLSIQTNNKTFKKILLSINEELQGGKSLGDCLAVHPGVFSELFVNMVRVGEAAGNLDEVLDIVATQLEKEHDLISKVKGAMTYPAVIVVAMFGIGILMMTYVLPQILGVFKDMEVELPASTKFIMSLSSIMEKHGLLVLLGFVGVGMLLRVFITTEPGKQAVSFLAINIPGIKNIVIKVNSARFARIYSSLLRSGVPAVDALQIISNTLTNRYFRVAIQDGIIKIQKGTSLSKIIAGHPKVFPILVSQMMEVGEETGKTETVLIKLAEFYEEEVNQITKNMSSIIEPILMIFIGSAVGFFAISMLQPMYGLMQNIK